MTDKIAELEKEIELLKYRIDADNISIQAQAMQIIRLSTKIDKYLEVLKEVLFEDDCMDNLTSHTRGLVFDVLEVK